MGEKFIPASETPISNVEFIKKVTILEPLRELGIYETVLDGGITNLMQFEALLRKRGKSLEDLLTINRVGLVPARRDEVARHIDDFFKTGNGPGSVGRKEELMTQIIGYLR